MLTAALGETLPERTTKTCSRCGGPLETRHLQGLEVEVCVRCGAAVLDRADLENLAASAVLSAPEARATESGVVVSRQTPVRPERKKPWDFTPRPAPPRKAPKKVEKALIPTLLEEGGDETTEEGPMIVGHRIHESEPPVRPREMMPESEIPTGPPSPAPFPKAAAPRGPGGSPLLSGAEPMLRRPPEAPPLPPRLGRTVRPDDGNAPSIRPSAHVNMTPEPAFGRIASDGVDEPLLDLDGPEPSTEEAFFDTTQKSIPVGTDPGEVVEWEDSRGSKVRSLLFVASALAALASVLAIASIGVWVFWLGPAWRERAATVDGPDLTEIVGSPSGGDLVIEHPEPVEVVVPDEVPVEPGTPEDGEGIDDAPVPTPVPITSPEPTTAPAPIEPAPRPPTPRSSAPSRSTLIARGWDTVESDPDAALEAFGQVLAGNADDYEAAYGYGYALLEKGDPAAAGPYLCRARPSPDVTIQREVDGLLARHAIQCP